MSRPVACPRCAGPLLRDENGKHDQGDRACLICGWRYYAQKPASYNAGERRSEQTFYRDRRLRRSQASAP